MLLQHNFLHIDSVVTTTQILILESPNLAQN